LEAMKSAYIEAQAKKRKADFEANFAKRVDLLNREFAMERDKRERELAQEMQTERDERERFLAEKMDNKLGELSGVLLRESVKRKRPAQSSPPRQSGRRTDRTAD
jgi:hypothetical protein